MTTRALRFSSIDVLGALARGRAARPLWIIAAFAACGTQAPSGFADEAAPQPPHGPSVSGRAGSSPERGDAAAVGAPASSAPAADAGSRLGSEPLEARIEAIDVAPAVGVWVGDFDADGLVDIALGPLPMDLASASVPKAAPDPALALRALALRHEAQGTTALSSEPGALDYSSATLVAELRKADAEPEWRDLVDALKRPGSGADGGAELTDPLILAVAKAVRDGAATEQSLSGVIGASFGASPTQIRDASLATRDGDSFSTCMRTPQTLEGCTAIQVMLLFGSVCPTWNIDNPTFTAFCGLFPRRSHCYQIPASAVCPDPEARIALCSKADDPSGCCNEDFLFTVMRSDLRNNAPLPIEPATGRMRDPSMPVILDGSAVYLEDGTRIGFPVAGTREDAVLGVGLDIAGWLAARIDARLALVFSYLSRLRENRVTRNSIELVVDAATLCTMNVTRPSHVLEGQVAQCLSEDPGFVYTKITGTGVNTRFAGLNENQGPPILQTALNQFVENVATTLRRVNELGLCCNGAALAGGTATILDRGGVEIVADGSVPVCGTTLPVVPARTSDNVAFVLTNVSFNVRPRGPGSTIASESLEGIVSLAVLAGAGEALASYPSSALPSPAALAQSIEATLNATPDAPFQVAHVHVESIVPAPAVEVPLPSLPGIP